MITFSCQKNFSFDQGYCRWIAKFGYDQTLVALVKKFGWRWNPEGKFWHTSNAVSAFTTVLESGQRPDDELFVLSKKEWKKLGFSPKPEFREAPVVRVRMNVDGRSVEQFRYCWSQVRPARTRVANPSAPVDTALAEDTHV